jgi:uncharacterized membrane protein YeiH
VAAVALVSCFSLRVLAIRHGWRLPIAKHVDHPNAKDGRDA